MRSYSFLFSLIFFLQVNAQTPATFSFNINGTVPAGFVPALNIAAQKWSTFLQINVPVKVNVFTVNSSLLPFSAITLANGCQNFTNAPYPNYLYTSALANQLAGIETNAGQYDMDIYFNLATAYYFGTGKPGSSQIDFISTAMHEIGHGLGFYSDGYVNGNSEGSFGNIPPSSIFPLTPSFPWHGQDGVPSVFDKYIVRMSNNALTTVAPNNTAALGDSIKNGPVYFSGPLYANASHSNTPVRLSGGAGTFTLGVDLLHIHSSYANTIMSYYWGSGDTVRLPAPWELGILKEIGWNMKAVGLRENSHMSIASAYPCPANGGVYIRARNISRVQVYNMQGSLAQTVLNENGDEELSVGTENLEEGIYFFVVSFSGASQPVTKKIEIRR
jgi:hypothetical protein